MSRNFALGIAKVLLIAGLITFVCYTIQWADKVTETNPKGDVVSEVHGRIFGPWDREVVEFQPEGEEKQPVRVGPNAEGNTVQAVAGFLTYLRNLDPWLFLAGALCYLFSLCASSVRWWWLLSVNSVQITALQALRFTWIGVFFNNVMPGQTGGDVVKALYIMKRAGPTGRVASIVSVIVDRILGLASLALLGAIIVLFYLDRFPEVAIGIWAVVLGVLLAGTVAFSRRIRKLVRLDALLRKLPMSGLLQRVDQAVFFYRGHKVGIAVWLLLGMLNHGVSIVSVLLIGNALNVGMPAVEYFALIPVINIVSAVPLFPAGWGIGEFAYGGLFAKYGARHLTGFADPGLVMATRGVALSVLYRIHLAIWSLVGGVLVLLEKDRVTRADVEEEIAREEQESQESLV